MRFKLFLNLFSWIIVILSFSCGSSEKDEIQKLLSARENAIETKNTDLYVESISKEYQNMKDGKLVKFEDIKKSFESNSKIFDSIELTSSDINIYIKDSNTQADVYQKTQYRLTIENDQSRYTVVEELKLKKMDGKWKIIKESDVDLFKAFAFGSSN